MKINLTIIFSFMLSSMIGQVSEQVDKPERVVYHYGSNETSLAAKEAINTCVKENNYDIISDKLFVGPLLWYEFKNYNSLNDMKAKNVELHVDNIKIKARLYEKLEDSKKVWDAFKAIISKNEYIIRKANYHELEYYWTIISWDIDEPLLVLETKDKRCFILDFEKNSNKLFWLDEFSPEHEGFNDLAKVENKKVTFSENLMEKETKLVTIKLLNTD